MLFNFSIAAVSIVIITIHVFCTLLLGVLWIGYLALNRIILITLDLAMAMTTAADRFIDIRFR